MTKTNPRKFLLMYTSGDYDAYGVEYTILCDPDISLKDVDEVMKAYESACEAWTQKTRELRNNLYHELFSIPCHEWKQENPAPPPPERRVSKEVKQSEDWQAIWKKWNNWNQRQSRFHSKKREEHRKEYECEIEKRGWQMPDLDKLLEEKFGPDRAYVPETEEIHRS